MPRTREHVARRPSGALEPQNHGKRGAADEKSKSRLRGVVDSRPVHVLALAVLLALLAAPTLLPKYSVVDNDIWLHLKVGDWIIEHSAVPYTGILSRTAADRPWMAYSWFYELLLSRFHSWFGLAGIGVYGLLLSLAVAYSTFWMVRRLSGTFWKASLLSTATCAAYLFSVFPRPVFFSMTLFTVTLTLLLEARRTGRLQLLYWLPPLFILWANVHIQFIYGIFTVGLFVGLAFLQECATRLELDKTSSLLRSPLPVRMLAVIFIACLVATCIGPYFFHLYSVVFNYATSKYPYTYVAEFQALNFRNYTDFVQLLLTGLAFFALGRRKQLDPFLLALLPIASIVGFRTQRDSWFICIPAAACIATSWGGAERERSETIWEKAGLVSAVTLLVFLYARVMGFNTPNLRLAVASVYPVEAINFLRDHPQPGPLYNSYDWGDFIVWYMPEFPVAIDGRTDLYGDELDTRSFLTINGDPSSANDPALNEANLVLLPRQRPLAIALTFDPRFSLIYQDSLAVVFVRR